MRLYQPSQPLLRPPARRSSNSSIMLTMAAFWLGLARQMTTAPQWLPSSAKAASVSWPAHMVLRASPICATSHPAPDGASAAVRNTPSTEHGQASKRGQPDSRLQRRLMEIIELH